MPTIIGACDALMIVGICLLTDFLIVLAYNDRNIEGRLDFCGII